MNHHGNDQIEQNTSTPPSLFDSAIILAVQAHACMLRKGSDTPYIVHPMEAAAIAATMTNDADILAAAVLHDVVEDTDVTLDMIRQAFGDRVAAIVASESEDKRNDRPAADTWLERKQEAIGHLSQSNDEAIKIVALADKLSNLRAMHRDSVTFGDVLWQRFNQKDKAMHAWYYKAIGKAFEGLLAHDAYKEYMTLLDKVFGSFVSPKGEWSFSTLVFGGSACHPVLQGSEGPIAAACWWTCRSACRSRNRTCARMRKRADGFPEEVPAFSTRLAGRPYIPMSTGMRPIS